MLIQILNTLLQLLVYCIVTSNNSMMDLFFRQCGQVILNEAKCSVGELPYVAETVGKLFGCIFLIHVVCCFLGVPWVFLFVFFCGCLFTLFVHGRLIYFYERGRSKQRVWLTAEKNSLYKLSPYFLPLWLRCLINPSVLVCIWCL